MPKRKLGIDVYSAAIERTAKTFDDFERVYLSFSAGKDSTVMLHIAAQEARKRGIRFGVMLVDLEGQYKVTIDHAKKCLAMYEDCIDVYWICLPLSLRNAVSVYEPKWNPWDKTRKDDWIRTPPEWAIMDEDHFEFFEYGMEFEDFVPLFGEWYSQGKSCACMVGIRSDESLNRFRTIASTTKTKHKGYQWTTKVTDNVYNIYPIYDWKTEDVWTYHAKFPEYPHNRLYDLMHQAGVSLGNQRICQPYGDDQRRGLWLFHLIEPETWSKVVARVNGANSGALYIQENGNINGYHKVTKPDNHTWQSFSKMLLESMPRKTQEHYENKIILFCNWWTERGYPEGIPDEAELSLEMKRDVPSWRRVCKSLLRNDYWCKGLGFTQHKSKAYQKYLDLMRRRKAQWKKDGRQMAFESMQ
ncbi:MAG: phosphoadenosine phosphosulfate reductase [Gammaproteobacteria bacterium]|nr:MAG: phosphoadenosine phosphosulfate reductase [Gammaproteobacteria bacterium]